MKGNEKTYWSKEIADLLEVGTSTLRKWCLLLEDHGYHFLRDEHDRRAFTSHDVLSLKKFKELTKDKQMSLENASNVVVSDFNRKDGDNRTLSASTFFMRSDERYNELNQKLDCLIEEQEQQKAFNQELLNKLNQQQKYIEESVNKRDEQIMTTLREIQESKKLLASAEEIKRKKKWKFWK